MEIFVMRASSRIGWPGVLSLMSLCLAAPLRAQDSGAYRTSVTERTTATPRRVTLDLSDVPLRDALRAVASQGGVSLMYASSTVPLEHRVSLRVHAVSVEEALRDALRGTDAEVRESSSGQMMLVKRTSQAESSADKKVPALGGIGGRITDSTTGTAVPRAVVSMDDGSRQTSTDDRGQYHLSDVPAGPHTVDVRRIGYAPAKRAITVSDGGTTTADFMLTPVASRLDEVVTTVTGPQRRLEVGNVIGAVDADSIVRAAPVTSLSDLINARVPGIQVVLNNGLTGTAPRIRIRGLNSLTVSNDPLLVVDGIRVENSSGARGAGYGQTAGRFNDLNPEEIESIEIVKGPSAATLYGTDAANGVIVVKTKRGRQGQATWNTYAEAGLIDQPTRFPDNYYAWGHAISTGAIQQCTLTQVAARACALDSLTTFNPLRTPDTSPIGTGWRRQTGAQLSGGAAGFTYFVAGDYEGETGFLEMPPSDRARISLERGGVAIPDEQLRPNALRKLSLRANASTSIGTNADLNVSSGLVRSDVRLVGDDIMFSAIFGPGYRTPQNGYLAIISQPGESFAVRNAESVMHYTTSANATWRPFPWLSARTTTGLDFSSTFLDDLQRRNEGPFGAGRDGRRLNRRTNVSQYSADAGASASFAPMARLTSRTSIGVQYNRRLQQVTGASGTSLTPGSETVTGAAVITGEEQTIGAVVAGSYAEQTLGLDERLFLTAALRADGGSAFGRDFRTAIYPKASASWIAVDQRIGWLNSARLRAAYGASGVQPASTAALALIAVAPAFVDGVAASGARLGAIGNPDLKPERQTELETGADLELVNGRVRMEATYYDRLSRDALINRPLASEFGIPARLENIGSVRNRGVEGLLSVTPIENGSLTWGMTLNGSVNHNRLEQIGAGIAFIGPNPAARSREGYPLVSQFARPILGFADANRNGIIEESEVTVGDSLVYLGPTLPPRQLTVASSLMLFHGRLRLSTQFDHRGGYQITNFSEANRCSLFLRDCRAVNDPTASLADQANAVALNSSRLGRTLFGYTEDASFTRWRELAVTYTLPDGVAHRLRAQTASMTVTGRNLHLFTRFSGIDPETNDTVGLVEGYGGNPTTPPARYWLLRVNLGL
jgi:TonB-linked SusC/RagA family outer membrane protein